MNKLIENLEENIIHQIYFVRGYKVMLDSDLAMLYGTSTMRLNEQVKRNLKRFPNDFMFRLTRLEFENLKSQFAISNSQIGENETDTVLLSQNAISKRGGRRSLPYVFTEHGTIMLASVLSTETAIDASIHIVRAFVKLREFLQINKDLARKIEELESKYDKQFQIVFEAIKQLISKENKPRKEIGYLAK